MKALLVVLGLAAAAGAGWWLFLRPKPMELDRERARFIAQVTNPVGRILQSGQPLPLLVGEV